MTKAMTVNWVSIKWQDPDKAVTAPNKYRRNDTRKVKTARHNKAVLFRRG